MRGSEQIGLSVSILANPGIVFLTVWALTLFLFNLQMTIQIVSIDTNGILMVGGNMAMALFLTLFFSKIKSKSRSETDVIDFAILKLYVKRLQYIWVAGTAIEIVVSGGVPLLWALSGQGFGKDYTDFGISSFHGIMNAAYLQFICGYFILWQLDNDRASRRKFFLFIVWPVFMLGRGIFLSIVMQCLAIFLLTHTIRIRRFLQIILIALANILLFGYIGNLRGTSNPFDYLVEQKWLWLFDMLPSGFLWVYIYVTSGINNIFFNVNSLEPTGAFDKTFFKLVPSFLRSEDGYSGRADNLIFADQNLNVSTFYAGVVSDFGTFGGFIYGSIIIIISSLIFSFARRHILWAMLAYAVFFQIIIFSVFFDMFLLLPTLMQVFIALYFIHFHRTRINRFRRQPHNQP